MWFVRQKLVNEPPSTQDTRPLTTMHTVTMKMDTMAVTVAIGNVTKWQSTHNAIMAMIDYDVHHDNDRTERNRAEQNRAKHHDGLLD